MASGSTWSLLTDSLSRFPGSEVRQGDTRITYHQLRGQVNVTGSRLLRCISGAAVRQPAQGEQQPSSSSTPAGLVVLQADVSTVGLPLVGLYMDQGLEYLTLVLTALSTRVAFLPLDPSWPDAHCAQVLAAAQPTLVITHPDANTARMASMLGGQQQQRHCMAVTAVELLGSWPRLAVLAQDQQDTQDTHATHTGMENATARRHTGTEEAVAGPQHPPPYCYVMFTSGSTGAPVGVKGTDAGLLNRINWMQRTYPLCEGDVVAVKTAVSFVDSLWEMLGPLAAGAHLLLLPPGLMLSPTSLAQHLAASHVTHLVSVPSLLRLLAPALLVQQQLGRLAALRLVVSSGEPLHHSLGAQLVAAVTPTCTVLNLYGSTEVAADCTCYDVRAASMTPTASSDATQHPVQGSSTPQPGDPLLPAGSPIDNMAVFVLPLPRDPEEEEEDSGPQGRANKHPAAAQRPLATGPNPSFTDHPAPVQQPQVSGTLAEATGRPAVAERVHPCGVGEVGEVCVAGPGVAAGYLNDAPRTALRFPRLCVATEDMSRVLAGPEGAAAVALAGATGTRESASGARALASDQGARVFRTRDLGYITPQGQLVVMGRLDHQVKVAGARVDLSAVEACLAQSPHVHEVAVILVDPLTLPSAHAHQGQLAAGDAPNPGVAAEGQVVLAAFVVPSDTSPWQLPGTSPPATQLAPSHALGVHLRHQVAQCLPAAAVPTAFLLTRSLPRNPAGKVLRPLLSHLLEQAHLEQANLNPLPSTVATPASHATRLLAPRAQPATLSGQVNPHGPTPHGPDSDPLLRTNADADGAGRDVGGAAGGVINHTSTSLPGASWSEAAVMRAVVRALGDPRLEPTDDYLAAGLTSLQAAGVAVELSCEPLLVLAARTVRALAGLLRGGAEPDAAVAAAMPDPGVVGPAGVGGERYGAGLPATARIVDGAPGLQGGGPAKRPRLLLPLLHAPVPPSITLASPEQQGCVHQAQGHHQQGRGLPAAPAAASTSAARVPADMATTLRAMLVTPGTQVTVVTSGGVQMHVVAGAFPAHHGLPAPLQAQPEPYAVPTLPCNVLQAAGCAGGAVPSHMMHEAAAASGSGACAGPAASGLHLSGAWRQPLGRCIDAAPVLVHIHPRVGTLTDVKSHTHRGATAPAPPPHSGQLSRGTSVPAPLTASHPPHTNQTQYDSAAPSQQGLSAPVGVHLVLAASHDGTVAAYDQHRGTCCWQTHLPARVEAGLTVCHVHGQAWQGLEPQSHAPGTQDTLDRTTGYLGVEGMGAVGAALDLGSGFYVVVVCGDGTLRTLDFVTGQLVGSCDLGGEPRSAPVTDPWLCDVTWATSHGRQLVAVRGPECSIVCREALPAACSTSPVFSLSQSLLLVACLDGSLHCWRRTHHTLPPNPSPSTPAAPPSPPPPPLAAATAATAAPAPAPPQPAPAAPPAVDDSGPAPVLLALQWTARPQAAAPVFSNPVVSETQLCVVCAHVDGCVRGYSLMDGVQRWAIQLDGHVFAALTLVPALEEWDGEGKGKAPAAEHDSPTPVPAEQPLPLALPQNQVAVLAATHAGSVVCLSASHGQLLWRWSVGHGKISCPPVAVPVWQGHSSCSSSLQHPGGNGVAVLDAQGQQPGTGGGVHAALLVLVASCGGVVSVMRVRCSPGQPTTHVLHEAQLPGELYSSPVLALHRGHLYLGCRDDNLYCIRIGT